ncbi:MAG: T9SS type A sorting domain-containing protein, partial [Bacteroidota bacterium]
TSSIALSGVKIEATGVPSWLSFKEIKQSLSVLKANQELALLFTFSVDKSAPVNREQVIVFAITSSAGEKWTKEIKVTVSPPDHFELFQNYPNPFNPTTAISYQLSADSRVSLKVFNLLGQEVTTVVEGERLAGHHKEVWEASRFSTGVYVYALTATDAQGNRHVGRRAMLLLK